MIKDLPDKLKLLRIKYGYSQRQVADKVNVSPSIVSAYETGERTPSIDVLLLLSDVYSCSVDYLVGKQTAEPTVVFDTNGLTDNQIRAIITLIESIKNK